eukprot:gene19922-30641_t
MPPLGFDEKGNRRQPLPWPLEGLGGVVNGKLWTAPLFVDMRKPPGHTSIDKVAYRPDGWQLQFFNLPRYIWSPHLVWFLISMVVYFAFPYDLKNPARRAMTWSLLLERCTVHTATMLAFFSFWHVTCYVLKFSKRRWDETVEGPSKSRLFHNIWYCILGGIQAGVWDAFFIHIYANKMVPYTDDAEAFSFSRAGAINAFLIVVVMMWRDTHFFLMHKFSHLRFFYKYVHALHHRNIQTEPFSGLSMHPVEHMYYFSSSGMLLFTGGSAFLPQWCLMHAVLAPAASHSGFEDIWQSDAFHAIHHQKFECNYGSSDMPMDHIAGTFRDSLRDHSSTYKGAVYDSAEPVLYDLVICVILPFLIYEAFVEREANSYADPLIPSWVPATALAFGPPVFGYLMTLVHDKSQRSWRWPFHK